MSNATDKLAIANVALLSIGQTRLANLTDVKPDVIKINEVLEHTIKELLGDDWAFSRYRAQLTLIYKLTTVAAPAAEEWAVGATLTGSTSGVTATVVEKISATEYYITEPSDDFTDGETISDGTSTAVLDESTDESVEFGSFDYRYLIPTGCLNIIAVVDLDSDKIRYKYQPEGRYILCNQTECYLLYNRFMGENGSTTVSDVTLTPMWFHRLISARVAYLLSENITKDSRLRPKVEIEWQSAYLAAKEQNGMQFYESRRQGNNNWAEGANNELGFL